MSKRKIMKKIYQKPLIELVLMDGDAMMQPISWRTGQGDEHYGIIEGNPTDDDVDYAKRNNAWNAWDEWDE